jgi:hypothetical protein
MHTDRDAVRAAARQRLGTYGRLPFYARMFADAGFPTAADGTMPDALFDALVVSGDPGHVAARLAAMSPAERDYWTGVVARSGADRDSLTFLAIALNAAGRPIGVANTDPATGLFLRERTPREDVLRDVHLFVRAYPVGLFIERVGPVVANDAYATPPVWRAFERDQYHGPRVVWGREVNLFLAGVANQIAGSRGEDTGYVRELRAAIDRVRDAVQASGFRSELWSYEIRDGRVVPVRYGVSSDLQLWSTTDLAVQYALARLR